MKIVRLESKVWSVYAVVSDHSGGEDSCELLEFLDTLPKQYHGSRAGIFQLFDRFAEHGPKAFNDAICHYVDQEEKIWEFIKGNLRILWFYAGQDRVIVCSHGFIKRSAKTPTAEKQKAIAAKHRYYDDNDNGNIVILE